MALTAGMVPVGLHALAPAPQADTVYSGVVSDAMCGVKHTMSSGSAADCTRMCVQGGSDYALVVGQKAYTLQTSDSKQLATLNKYAGQRVVVRGKLSGTTLTVHSVAPAGK